MLGDTAQGLAADVTETGVPVTIHGYLRPNFFVYIRPDL